MSRLTGFAEVETLNHLRISPSPERLASLSTKLNTTADQEISIAHEKGPKVACGKGCSHCCSQFVTVVIPEVLLLASAIRANYSPHALAALKFRIAEYLEEIDLIPKDNRIALFLGDCPILENDLCGAFEARPLACRRYNSVDVQACILRKSGERKQPPLANPTQTEVGNSFLSGLAIGLRRSRLQEALVEFIPALDIALRNPDAAERYLAGEPLFDSVIVAGYDPSAIRKAIKARTTLGIPIDS